jgi:diguanylate cyclase (GGDEF)-like protein/PAS domain S-box-containing protein
VRQVLEGPPVSEVLAPGVPGSGVGHEGRFSALVEHVNDIVVVLDATGAVRYANPASRRLGYDLAAWLGQSAFAAVHPDDLPRVQAAFAAVMAGSGRRVPLQFRLRRADGSLMVAEALATNRLADPGVAGVVVTVRDVTARTRAEEEARAADRLHRTLVESLAEGVALTDRDGVLLLGNSALERLLEVPLAALLGKSLPAVLELGRQLGWRTLDAAGRPLPAAAHPTVAVLRSGQPVLGQLLGIRRPEGSVCWCQVSARPVRDARGAVVGSVSSITDVSALRRADRDLMVALGELERERTFLRVLLDNLEEGIVACDEDGRLTIVNPAGRRFLGLTETDAGALAGPADPAGQATWRTLDGRPLDPSRMPLARALRGESVREVQLLLEDGSGTARVVEANAQALASEEGQPIGAVLALHDVTEHKRTEAELTSLALTDPLTKLANRLVLEDRLRRSLERLRRSGGGVGVLLLDLDGFKEVNDRYGHETGDQVLQMVARRLAAAVRPEDTVARLGGDELVVVCDVAGAAEEVALIALRVEEALARPYRVGELTLEVSASVGWVVAEDPEADPDELVAEADARMYRAKARRRAARPGDA